MTAPPMAAVAARSDNPYVGPRPFRRGERLHGRDREASGLADKLLGERIVLLHSPSGAGKTSLIQAMLVPAMEERGFQICARVVPSFSALRVNNPPPSTFPVRNRYVFSAVLGLLDGAAEDASGLADVTLAEALDRMRDQLKTERPQAEPYQFVVFDQLEEVLTLNPADREFQLAFFRQLGEALEDDRRWALLSMREDYMGGLDRFTPQLPTGLRSRYRLDFLEKDAALEAIQDPARDRGVDFTDEAAAALVDDLRKVRVQGPCQEPMEISGPYVEPVHLQVVCHRLWRAVRDRIGAAEFRSITAEQIRPFRDIAGALGAYYADAVRDTARHTTTDERLIRDWFEDQLITAQHFRSQTVVGPGGEAAASAAVLERLERRYLVRADLRAGTRWYELSHDRLVEPVLADNASWRRRHLADWQNRAEEWRRTKDPSLLLTGEALREARRAVSGLQSASTAAQRNEQEFVELSTRAAESSTKAKAEERFRLRANRTVVALAAIILVELVVILVLLVAA